MACVSAGVTEAEKTPSPNKRRKKLGSRKATKKMSVCALSKKAAMLKSRTKPKIRLKAVPRDMASAKS